MTSPWSCQSVVCSGGRCLAQLRDPGISAPSQRGVRVGAPRATFQLTPLPSLEPEVLSSYPQGTLPALPLGDCETPGLFCNLTEPLLPYLRNGVKITVALVRVVVVRFTPCNSAWHPRPHPRLPLESWWRSKVPGKGEPGAAMPVSPAPHPSSWCWEEEARLPGPRFRNLLTGLSLATSPGTLAGPGASSRGNASG